jgi:ABC-type sugar transport system ATPase subunit
VLYVTHDQVEAMVLADRIAVMAHGEILQIGNPSELYRAPANALVAEFFGSINWLRGRMADGAAVETEIGRLEIAAGRQYEGNVVVGVRPEDIKLAPASADATNRLDGTVVSATFLGDQATTEVKIKERTLIVKTLPDDAKPKGAIAVQLPKERIVVFPDN